MKQILCSLFLVLSVNVCAQDTSYARIYEPFVGELHGGYPVSDAEVIWDDGLFTSGTMNWNSSAFLARIDPNGNLVWQKAFFDTAGQGGFEFNEIITTQDSNFVAVGKLIDTMTGEFHPLCIKLDPSGDTLWTKSFGLMNQSVGNYGLEFQSNGHVVETMDSMLLMGFHHSSYQVSASTPDRFSLNKLNMNGDIVWSKSFLAEKAFYLSSIRQAEDSSIYVIGNSQFNGAYGYVVNLSESGQMNWALEFEGIQLHDMELDSNIYLSWSDDTSRSGVLKLSMNGNQLKRVGRYSEFQSFAPNIEIAKRSNGTLVTNAVQPAGSWYSGVFIEMTENLDLIGSKELNLKIVEVIAIPNKGIYATGFGPFEGIKKIGDVELGVIRFDSLMNAPDCASPGSSILSILDTVVTNTALFTISDSTIFFHLPFQYQTVDFVSEDGCITTTSSVNEIAGTWNETIFPNPSNGEFTISWGEYRDVEWVIYNSIGKEVYRGKTKNSFVEIDLKNDQNGLYYYRLADEAGSQSNGKLSLMK